MARKASLSIGKTPSRASPGGIGSWASRNRSQPEVITANQKNQPVDWEAFLAGFAGGKTDVEYGANRNIFCQGQPADSVFYLRQGKVKIAVTSDQGKEAIVAILGEGDFFGEGCLAGQPLRIATATT